MRAFKMEIWGNMNMITGVFINNVCFKAILKYYKFNFDAY